jgi:nitrate/TMAO reductase-like tetraheme cytochrome c subunit
MSRKTILTVLVLIIFMVAAGLLTADHYTSKASVCGSCHIMRPYFNSWEKSIHGEKDVACVDCHYPPGESHSLQAKFKGLGQLFTYTGTNESTVRKSARVSDLSCTTSKCHTPEKFMDKKLKFAEKITYVHRTHMDKTIEGQVLHCDTCHQHVRTEKHFEVPRVACYLCHFKESTFNEGRAKCSLCHEIPTKPLQKQKEGNADGAEKSVTHESLKQASVPCQSCHYELVQGKGGVKVENCFDCHEYSDEMLKNAEDKKMMHEEHVAMQNAECFECHRPIRHEKIEFLDPVREACTICHPDHHGYQKQILIGDKRKDVMEAPGLMYDVKTNCVGCHVDEGFVKGEKVLYGSSEACVSCHTARYETMVKEWREKTGEEISYAKEIEKEAIGAIKKTGGTIEKDRIDKAMTLLEEGRENLRIVEYGGGVHNMKYAVILLDGCAGFTESRISHL